MFRELMLCNFIFHVQKYFSSAHARIHVTHIHTHIYKYIYTCIFSIHIFSQNFRKVSARSDSRAHTLFLDDTVNEKDKPSSASILLVSKHALLESALARNSKASPSRNDTKRDTDSRHYRGYIPSYTRYLNPHGSLVSRRRDLVKTTQPSLGLEAPV